MKWLVVGILIAMLISVLVLFIKVKRWQSNRKNGRWVKKEDDSYCSECGRKAMLFINGVGDHQTYRSPYCPHCGAYMWGYKR